MIIFKKKKKHKKLGDNPNKGGKRLIDRKLQNTVTGNRRGHKEMERYFQLRD